jgi:hypothetical protein
MRIHKIWIYGALIAVLAGTVVVAQTPLQPPALPANYNGTVTALNEIGESVHINFSTFEYQYGVQSAELVQTWDTNKLIKNLNYVVDVGDTAVEYLVSPTLLAPLYQPVPQVNHKFNVFTNNLGLYDTLDVALQKGNPNQGKYFELNEFSFGSTGGVATNNTATIDPTGLGINDTFTVNAKKKSDQQPYINFQLNEVFVPSVSQMATNTTINLNQGNVGAYDTISFNIVTSSGTETVTVTSSGVTVVPPSTTPPAATP